MNQDKKLLVKKEIENIVDKIHISSLELLENNKKLEISKNILLDYYNLITNIISDESLTNYLLHKISRAINDTSSILEKELLLSLLPEFYIPFINSDMSLTEPYLSRILTSIQSNILSDISPLYIGEIFKKIILNVFNGDDEFNKEAIDLFEICQGFCLYNMKLNHYNYQLCGIVCLNILLNEIDLSFLNINNYMSYIWGKIDWFLNLKNFVPKEYLLKYIYDLISIYKVPFKPYVNLSIYKILEFIDNKNANIRKNALNVLSLLISFYPNEIKPIKTLIIQLLTILKSDKDENIRNKATYIYNKIDKQYETITNTPKKNNKLSYFYYIDKSTNHNKDNMISESNNENRINDKKKVARNNKINNNINTKNNSTIKIKEVGGIIDFRQKSCKSIYENGKYFIRNKKKDLNENKRYDDKYTVNSCLNKYININDSNDKNEIGFRELLNIVKENSDNKCSAKNNFSNLRDEIKKIDNGLKLIRKIKK